MKYSFTLAVLVLTSCLVACSTPDEKTRLQETLDELVGAVEARSVTGVQKYFSNDFKTTRHADTQQVKTFMLLQFRQNRVINVFTSDVEINLQQDKADVSFNALVTGSSNWLPERGRRFLIESRWIKRDGDWKISRVNWKEQTGFN